MRIEPVLGVRLNTSPAVEAFLNNFDQIAPAYEYNWTQQESYQRRAKHLTSGGYRTDRAALADALQAYNLALGSGPTTLESIAALRQPETLTVVTGQQAGIFTGPAYSIYKAMTAIHLATQQSERLGQRVVPVFWIAGEDHDWQEVSWVNAPAGDSLAKIHLQESFDGDRRSVGMAPIPASLAAAMEHFLALIPETEFKAEVAARIQSASTAPPALNFLATASLADWFGRLITWLFDGTGLIVLNPIDPALRALAAPFLATAIRCHEAVGEALGTGFERFSSLGFTPSVDRQMGQVNLFTYIDNERLPLMGAGDQFWIRDREETGWTTEALVDRALTKPDLFSTNVVLRPVLQGFLLPDLAYVGGPGEISYWGLLRDVFTTLNQQMPIVYPRESYTLLEPPLARLLEKQELTLTEVLYRLDDRRKEFIEREDRLGISGLFEKFRGDFDQIYSGLVDVVHQLDPNLHFVTEENRKQIGVQIGKLEEKARQQHRKNLEVALRQFDRLGAHLNPDGLQERSVSILPYLAKYGPDLVQRLVQSTQLGNTWEHRVVYLAS